MSVKDDLDFQRIVQQRVVTPKFYKRIWKDVIEVDIRLDKLSQLFDLDAGIDKVVKIDNELFGLAQRIQRKRFADKETITWRVERFYENKSYIYKSEWHKIQKMMHSHGLKASYQSHCYVNANEAESVTDIIDAIIVDRFALVDWLGDNSDIIGENQTKPDQLSGQVQRFYFVKFKDIPQDFVIARYKNGDLVHSLEQYHKPISYKQTKQLRFNL